MTGYSSGRRINREHETMLVNACGTEHQPVVAMPPIVSLVPSLTELMFALDLGEQVVERT